jgi:hypothetical protein
MMAGYTIGDYHFDLKRFFYFFIAGGTDSMDTAENA